MVQKLEYKILKLEKGLSQNENKINALAKKGWELITVVAKREGKEAYFKRLI